MKWRISSIMSRSMGTQRIITARDFNLIRH
jgi:hypothetical protein